MIYFFISLVASIFGSILGIGGGIIITPILLMIGVNQNLAAFSSAISVLSMAVITCSKNIRNKRGDYKAAILITIGSIPFSYAGSKFNETISPKIFSILYIVLLVLLLVLMLNKNKLKNLSSIFNKYWIFKPLFGCIIGFLAGLFGIGGGPIVIPILHIIFLISEKEVPATSSFITLITSFVTIISYSVNGTTDFSLGLQMIPAAIIGAQIGAVIGKRINERTILILYNILLVILILQQSFYGIIRYIF